MDAFEKELLTLVVPEEKQGLDPPSDKGVLNWLKEIDTTSMAELREDLGKPVFGGCVGIFVCSPGWGIISLGLWSKGGFLLLVGCLWFLFCMSSPYWCGYWLCNKKQRQKIALKEEIMGIRRGHIIDRTHEEMFGKIETLDAQLETRVLAISEA